MPSYFRVSDISIYLSVVCEQSVRLYSYCSSLFSTSNCSNALGPLSEELTHSIWFFAGYRALLQEQKLLRGRGRAGVETVPAALFLSHPCEYMNF